MNVVHYGWRAWLEPLEQLKAVEAELSHVWVDKKDRYEYRHSDGFLFSSLPLSPGS